MKNETIETIYFGGGTPSLLSIADCRSLIEKIFRNFSVDPSAEITLEVNPDDISNEKLAEWKAAGINRLSIGIQSLFDEDLKWMNRAHNTEQALTSLSSAIKQFNNITIDLIYGTPFLTNERWQSNVKRVIEFNIPHLSCYALTVEPKTPLYKMIEAHKTPAIDADKQSDQFMLLMQWTEEAGYEHYEISNFARPGFRSRHNSSYWRAKSYLGIGPSAHSFNGESRQWNVANNNIYIDSIKKAVIPFEIEVLTPGQQLNEYIMTSLRTMEGLDLEFFEQAASYKLQAASKKFIERNLMIQEQRHLKLTKKGKLFADGIAAELFFEEADKIVK